MLKFYAYIVRLYGQTDNTLEDPNHTGYVIAGAIQLER